MAEGSLNDERGRYPYPACKHCKGSQPGPNNRICHVDLSIRIANSAAGTVGQAVKDAALGHVRVRASVETYGDTTFCEGLRA